ncbi:hypothetical protein ACF3NA_01080 [Alkanindiges sp. WGS2144]|uniref:hypothetical protein n=1 Tax=Alkanindiges sp. WGS2144 TaxID=3366808 RepID=UPI003750DE15
MITKQLLGAVLGITLSLSLAGCNKTPETSHPANAGAIEVAQDTNHKSENDLYIERLNQDVTVENPDALLDSINSETTSTH